ncbi:uncharacterized protein [Cardiocondyla obscurior]|uniref:uncharacterized protein n=1 Tax=Cardiocondyla obscurior TaxID=286306 RepID=UPI0039655C02
MKGKYDAVYGQYVSLDSVLKKFFELPNILKDTLAYMSYLSKENSGLQNFIQVLKFLENEGILVQSNLEVKRVYFVLGLLTGDNLGLHQLFGLVESFSASYFCRLCKMHKKDTQKAVKEDPSLLRNLINYNNDIQLDNTSETGIKEECVFHDISSYHFTENYTVDELHDGREGLCNVDMLIILRNLTHGKYKCFNLEILNNRMLMFGYGPKDSLNKPPRIYKMLCFVRLFGIFVGDLVYEDNPYWQLYLLMRQILDVILAKKLSKGSISYLKVLIQEHHELFISLAGESLTPKLHFLIHYPTIIEQSGPISHLSTIRCEAKQRNLTQAAASNMSRVNISYSISVKHQMSLCHRFLTKEGLIPDLETSPGQTISFNETLPFIQVLPPELKGSECTSYKWIKYKGTTYKLNMVVIVGAENLCPLFGEVNQIIISDSNCPLLLCKKLVNIGLYEHVLGYEVATTKDWICININDLLDPYPTYAYAMAMANGEKYVILHSNL